MTWRCLLLRMPTRSEAGNDWYEYYIDACYIQNSFMLNTLSVSAVKEMIYCLFRLGRYPTISNVNRETWAT